MRQTYIKMIQTLNSHRASHTQLSAQLDRRDSDSSPTRVLKSWSGVRAIGGEPGRLKATVSCADWIPVRLRSRARGGGRQPSARLAGARGALARKVLSTRSRPPVGAGMRLLDRCTRAHVASAAVTGCWVSSAEARRMNGYSQSARARAVTD